MNSQSDTQARRIHIRAIFKIMATMLILAMLWVGFSFVATVEDPEANVKVMRFDLSGIKPGETEVFDWNRRPLIVLHRSSDMLEFLRAGHTERLRDALSDNSNQPEPMQNFHRSLIPEYFVAIATGTDLGCPVVFLPAQSETFQGEHWKGGFRDSCRGSRYDLAGRVFENQQASENLVIPAYRIDGSTLVAGAN